MPQLSEISKRGESYSLAVIDLSPSWLHQGKEAMLSGRHD
jgi:hypothetical protein